MLANRGEAVDRTTIYRCIETYAPELENGCSLVCRFQKDSINTPILRHSFILRDLRNAGLASAWDVVQEQVTPLGVRQHDRVHTRP